MKILINDHRKIYAIEHEFSELFPYLKLNFFSKSQKSENVASFKIIKNQNKTLGESRTIHSKGNLTITPNMTVADLENNFRNIYGISVHVLRKSGNAWLETTVTDGWTLEEQNKQGAELSKHILK